MPASISSRRSSGLGPGSLSVGSSIREDNAHARCISSQELGFFREQISREEKLLEVRKRRGREPDAIFKPAKAVEYMRSLHTSTGFAMEDVPRAEKSGKLRYQAVSRRAPKFREPDIYRWYPKSDTRPSLTVEKRTDTPAAAVDARQRTYRIPRGGDVGDAEEAVLLERLAVIEQERAVLVADLAANSARKDTKHSHRGAANTFLDTYRPPETARGQLLPGETHGKIYSH